MNLRDRRLGMLQVVTLCAVWGLPGLSATSARADDFELTFQAGKALPFYQQSFGFDPGDLVPPEIPVETTGAFDLDLDGGLSLAGAFTWRFTDRLGLEARIDSAQVNLEVKGGRVSADLGDLIPGLPSIPISGDISGQSSVDRLTPFSLNLQATFGERTRFVVSGGVSYIPSTRVATSVRVQLNLDGVPGASVPPLGVSAAATLDGGFGANLGLGVRVPLRGRLELAFDARAFAFPERELEWGSGGGSSPIEEALAANLDPIEFRYGFFHLTGGLGYRF